MPDNRSVTDLSRLQKVLVEKNLKYRIGLEITPGNKNASNTPAYLPLRVINIIFLGKTSLMHFNPKSLNPFWIRAKIKLGGRCNSATVLRDYN